MKLIPNKIVDAGASGLLNIISGITGFIQNPHGRTIRTTINANGSEVTKYTKMPKNIADVGGLIAMDYMHEILDSIMKENWLKDSLGNISVRYKGTTVCSNICNRGNN